MIAEEPKLTHGQIFQRRILEPMTTVAVAGAGTAMTIASTFGAIASGDAEWIGLTICGMKRLNSGNLLKPPKTPSPSRSFLSWQQLVRKWLITSSIACQARKARRPPGGAANQVPIRGIHRGFGKLVILLVC
jgi:hypothetical protein